MPERSYPDPADWNITSQVLAARSGDWMVLQEYPEWLEVNRHVRQKTV